MKEGTIVGFSSLYTDIAPQTAILPFLFIFLITSVDAGPPTFSKKQSIPFGAPSASAASVLIYHFYRFYEIYLADEFLV